MKTQGTLYGAWKMGTLQQQQPVAVAGLYAFRSCGGRFAARQALAVHVKCKHKA
jgi:hypothetical protein